MSTQRCTICSLNDIKSINSTVSGDWDYLVLNKPSSAWSCLSFLDVSFRINIVLIYVYFMRTSFNCTYASTCTWI